MNKVYITDYINNPNIEKKILGKNLSLKEIFKIISHSHKGSKTSYKVKNTIDAGPRYRYALRKNLDLLGFKQSIYLRKGIHLINSHQN